MGREMILIDHSPNGIRTKTRKFHDHQRAEAREFLQRLKDKNYTPSKLRAQKRTPYDKLSATTYRVWGDL